MKLTISIALTICAFINIIEANYMRVCIYKERMQFGSSSNRLDIEEIDPFLCSHIMQTDFTIDTSPSSIEDQLLNSYSRTYLQSLYRPLRIKNRKLKTIASVDTYRALYGLSDDNIRKSIVKNVTLFLRTYDWDGLNFGSDSYKLNIHDDRIDKFKFTQLIKDFAEAFKAEAIRTRRPKLLLSATVSGKKEFINHNYETHELGKYLDFITVEAYNFHGKGEQQTGHHAAVVDDGVPLSNRSELTVSFAVDYWISKGVPAYKINLGLPMFANSYELQDSNKNGLGAPTTGKGLTEGPISKEVGFLAYVEMCKLIQSRKVRVVDYQYYSKAKASYAYGGSAWYGFDDKDSLLYKIRSQVKGKGLAGVTVQALDMDDPRNSCNGGKYPLTNAIREELGEYDDGCTRKM